MGQEIHSGIMMKFCLDVDVHDIITCAEFDDEQITRFGYGAGVKFQASH